MAVNRALVHAHVLHRRVGSKPYELRHKVYYVCIANHARQRMSNLLFSCDRPNVFSLWDRDYGFGTQGGIAWVEDVLKQHDLSHVCTDIELLTMPRVLGYSFNPVSFWLCRDDTRALRAVVAEVNNTFGERHAYLLANVDGAIITRSQWLLADKRFHVSPFFTVTGSYRFRFHDTPDQIGIWIDYRSAQGDTLLKTALLGKRSVLSARSLSAAFWAYPLVTLKVIVMIHVHALRMVLKGFRPHRKPPLTGPEVTR